MFAVGVVAAVAVGVILLVIAAAVVVGGNDGEQLKYKCGEQRNKAMNSYLLSGYFAKRIRC